MAGLSSKPAVPMRLQPLETNLFILARLAAARQLAFAAELTLSILLAVLRGKSALPSFPARLTSLPGAQPKARRCAIQFNKDRLEGRLKPFGAQGSRILPRRICLGGYLVACSLDGPESLRIQLSAAPLSTLPDQLVPARLLPLLLLRCPLYQDAPTCASDRHHNLLINLFMHQRRCKPAHIPAVISTTSHHGDTEARRSKIGFPQFLHFTRRSLHGGDIPAADKRG
jgi:hypothetical protein